MADKKDSFDPNWVSPKFEITRFGVGDMYTRKGSGRMTEDLPSDLGSAKPGRYGAHYKEEDELSPLAYAKGGKVIKSEKY